MADSDETSWFDHGAHHGDPTTQTALDPTHHTSTAAAAAPPSVDDWHRDIRRHYQERYLAPNGEDASHRRHGGTGASPDGPRQPQNHDDRVHMSVSETSEDIQWTPLDLEQVADVIKYSNPCEYYVSVMECIAGYLLGDGMYFVHKSHRLSQRIAAIFENTYDEVSRQAIMEWAALTGVVCFGTSVHPSIDWVPTVLPLNPELHRVNLYVNTQGIYHYQVVKVRPDGKSVDVLQRVIVVEFFRPTPFGRLTSPMAHVLRRLARQERVYEAYDISVERNAKSGLMIQSDRSRLAAGSGSDGLLKAVEANFGMYHDSSGRGRGQAGMMKTSVYGQSAAAKPAAGASAAAAKAAPLSLPDLQEVFASENRLGALRSTLMQDVESLSDLNNPLSADSVIQALNRRGAPSSADGLLGALRGMFAAALQHFSVQESSDLPGQVILQLDKGFTASAMPTAMAPAMFQHETHNAVVNAFVHSFGVPSDFWDTENRRYQYTQVVQYSRLSKTVTRYARRLQNAWNMMLDFYYPQDEYVSSEGGMVRELRSDAVVRDWCCGPRGSCEDPITQAATMLRVPVSDVNISMIIGWNMKVASEPSVPFGSPAVAGPGAKPKAQVPAIGGSMPTLSGGIAGSTGGSAAPDGAQALQQALATLGSGRRITAVELTEVVRVLGVQIAKLSGGGAGAANAAGASQCEDEAKQELADEQQLFKSQQPDAEMNAVDDALAHEAKASSQKDKAKWMGVVSREMSRFMQDMEKQRKGRKRKGMAGEAWAANAERMRARVEGMSRILSGGIKYFQERQASGPYQDSPQYTASRIASLQEQAILAKRKVQTFKRAHTMQPDDPKVARAFKKAIRQEKRLDIELTLLKSKNDISKKLQKMEKRLATIDSELSRDISVGLVQSYSKEREDIVSEAERLLQQQSLQEDEIRGLPSVGSEGDEDSDAEGAAEGDEADKASGPVEDKEEEEEVVAPDPEGKGDEEDEGDDEATSPDKSTREVVAEEEEDKEEDEEEVEKEAEPRPKRKKKGKTKTGTHGKAARTPKEPATAKKHGLK